MSPRDPLIPGYDIVDVIGRGGFAVVYRAVQQSVDRMVALKVVSVSGLEDATERRFRGECRTVGELSWHPHVVALYDAGLSDAGPYLAMELLPGGSWGRRVRELGGRPPAEVVTVGIQVADALSVAHEAGIIHRDIKPDNLMVGRRGEALLADFGTATLAAANRSTTGSFIGTLAYSAPELLQGQRASPTSDVFSLGATMHALLTGSAPFVSGTEDSPAAVMWRVVSEAPPELPVHVPPELDALVAWCMQKDPGDRPQSVHELEGALHSVRGGLSTADALITKVPDGSSRPGGRPHTREAAPLNLDQTTPRRPPRQPRRTATPERPTPSGEARTPPEAPRAPGSFEDDLAVTSPRAAAEPHRGPGDGHPGRAGGDAASEGTGRVPGRPRGLAGAPSDDGPTVPRPVDTHDTDGGTNEDRALVDEVPDPERTVLRTGGAVRFMGDGVADIATESVPLPPDPGATADASTQARDPGRSRRRFLLLLGAVATILVALVVVATQPSDDGERTAVDVSSTTSTTARPTTTRPPSTTTTAPPVASADDIARADPSGSYEGGSTVTECEGWKEGVDCTNGGLSYVDIACEEQGCVAVAYGEFIPLQFDGEAHVGERTALDLGTTCGDEPDVRPTRADLRLRLRTVEAAFDEDRWETAVLSGDLTITLPPQESCREAVEAYSVLLTRVGGGIQGP